MKRMRGFLAVAALAVLLASPALGTDEFYTSRLQEGRIAYQSGNAPEAVDHLRIACFGLMDRPPLLSESLVWLALAQSKAGKTEGLETTTRRFLEVEKRLAPYSQANLPPAVRKDFEALLVRVLPPEVLLATPSLVALVETDEQKFAKLPPEVKRKSLEARAKAAPTEVTWPLLLARLAVEQKDPKAAARWAGRVLEMDEENLEAREIRARALFQRRDFTGALNDLRTLPPEKVEGDAGLRADLFVCLVDAKRWDVAREALTGLPEDLLDRPDVAAAAKKVPAVKAAAKGEASEVAPAATPEPTPAPPGPAAGAAMPSPTVDELKKIAREHAGKNQYVASRSVALKAVAAAPNDREARNLVLEAACMLKDWDLVAAQAKALEPFADGEEPAMFYTAVALYETGRKAEAMPLLQRARRRIGSSPFVDYYSRRILD